MSSKKSKRSTQSKAAKSAKPAKAEPTAKKPDVAIVATEKSRKAVIDSIQSRLDGKTPPPKLAGTKESPKAPKGEPMPKSAPGAPKAKRSRLSAIDAAAQVLAKSGKPMKTQDLVDAMATSGLWKSPGGKTPAATLSAAIGREIKTLGSKARFKKAERGLFASTPMNTASKGG